MGVLVRSTLKLLFRNPGFWFFMIVTPILSVVILRTEQNNLGAYEIVGAEEIIELDKPEDKVAYYGGKGKYVIKVYDAAESELADYMLDKLGKSGAFLVCRVKVPGMSKADADARMARDGYEDRMGSAIYIGKGFEEGISSGDMGDSLVVYTLSEDERNELLDSELKMIIGQLKTAALASAASGDEGLTVMDTLREMNKAIPSKQVISLAGKNSRNLTNDQLDQKALMGYALAILTLGFVFGGIFIAHTAIAEQENMVFTRIRLTNLSPAQYFTAKFLSAGVIAVMLTAVTGLCSFAISTDKLGIGRVEFLILIFMLGLIFSTVSLLLGILFGNVMSANVAAFALWSMSSMLAGLYFPLDSTTKAVRTISYMMPQKWFLDATEMMMVRDNRVYFMVLCVTVAYMIVTVSLGSVGIKYKNYE